MENEIKKPSNPSAFPVELEVQVSEESGYCYDKGMTLLDYFAAKVLQGFMANPDFTLGREQTLSGEAYKIASEMLKEREKHLK